MVLIVSGAPFTAPINSPEGRAEIVDIRLRADEKWNRRRIINLVPWGASFFEGVTESPRNVGQWEKQERGVSIFTITKGPFHSIQGSLLHGIANNGTIIELDECVGSGQGQDSLPSHLLHINQGLVTRSITQSATRRQHFITLLYPTPATPSKTRSVAVIVPVLSKQQTSTLPANGIRKGSVQKIADLAR